MGGGGEHTRCSSARQARSFLIRRVGGRQCLLSVCVRVIRTRVEAKALTSPPRAEAPPGRCAAPCDSDGTPCLSGRTPVAGGILGTSEYPASQLQVTYTRTLLSERKSANMHEKTPQSEPFACCGVPSSVVTSSQPSASNLVLFLCSISSCKYLSHPHAYACVLSHTLFLSHDNRTPPLDAPQEHFETRCATAAH